ncbi:MAG: PQQ-binding-like beta-propeller repeat protein [Planctomycetes bacterium]|nr:PQQ-binding-like beta-propeller repeat protein [Planctomycetota bacterium]
MNRFALASTLVLAVVALLAAGGCTGAPSDTAAANATATNSTTVACTACAACGSDTACEACASGTACPACAAAATEQVAFAGAPPAEDGAADAEKSATAAQAKTAAQPASSVKAGQRDWAYWRGPQYNGVSYETGLPDDFDPDGGEGSNVSWKRDDVGGRSSPIVMNGRFYTIVPDQLGTPREGEKVICLNADTGETLWENRFNVWLSDVPAERVGWSSVVGDPETDRVYALGVGGYFQCIDGKSGETLWDVPMHEFFGLLTTYGGRTNFPLIHEDLVIISGIVIGWGEMAKPNHRFIAFDKMNGEVVWYNGTRDLPDDTTYSAPTIAVINGQKMLIAGAGDGAAWAFQPRTGKPIWYYNISRRGVNLPPLVAGERVYMGQSEENTVGTTMGAVAAIDPTQTGNITDSGRVWQQLEIMVGKSAPLLVDDRLYVFEDGAKLYILDPDTGEKLFPRKSLGTVMRASPLYADGKIYALEANGRWYIMQPDEDQGVEILSRGRFDGECHAAPIAVNGKVYLVTTTAIYCLEDTSKQQGYNEPPAAPEEAPASPDEAVAHVQVIPCELLAPPDRTQTFKVRLFNDRGQLLRVADANEVKYEYEGAGTVSPDGVFQASPDAAHKAAYVKASVGDVSGESRIRVVPPLPWKFDLEGLSEPPVTWVGARYRHVIRNVDGSNVMVKITTIPKGTRSRSWMGPTDLHDYTVQAEVMGAEDGGKLPEIGLIAQGYTFDMQGDYQRLQIRTWDAQLRMARETPFAWKPNVWYVMKFRASNEGGKAVLRGKVWPKGEEEPAEWLLEAADDVPNVKGAPGLYGNATDAEIFIDNITVTPNES